MNKMILFLMIFWWIPGTIIENSLLKNSIVSYRDNYILKWDFNEREIYNYILESKSESQNPFSDTLEFIDSPVFIERLVVKSKGNGLAEVKSLDLMDDEIKRIDSSGFIENKRHFYSNVYMHANGTFDSLKLNRPEEVLKFMFPLPTYDIKVHESDKIYLADSIISGGIKQTTLGDITLILKKEEIINNRPCVFFEGDFGFVTRKEQIGNNTMSFEFKTNGKGFYVFDLLEGYFVSSVIEMTTEFPLMPFQDQTNKYVLKISTNFESKEKIRD